MENSERPCYKCYNCTYFQRYFLKKRTQFVRAKYGFCRKREETVPVQNTCENFIFKCRRITVNKMVQGRLDDLLTEISTLRSFLQEEERERIEWEARRKKL